MTSLQLSLQYHTGHDAEQLRERLTDFRRTYRRIELPITVWPWDAAWENLVRIALYKDGADVSEIGTTWLGSFVGMDAIRPFTAQELSRMGGAELRLSCRRHGRTVHCWAIRTSGVFRGWPTRA